MKRKPKTKRKTVADIHRKLLARKLYKFPENTFVKACVLYFLDNGYLTRAQIKALKAVRYQVDLCFYDEWWKD
jgi:hypothetical protein